MMFCEVVRHVGSSLSPKKLKLFLFDAVFDPVEAHVKCFGKFLTHGVNARHFLRFSALIECCGLSLISCVRFNWLLVVLDQLDPEVDRRIASDVNSKSQAASTNQPSKSGVHWIVMKQRGEYRG
jgi:hypothetical protein